MTIIEIDCRESSNLHSARYDADARVLEISFKSANGAKTSTYRYEDVGPLLWEDLCAAESKGKFFAANIKVRFKGVKIWP